MRAELPWAVSFSPFRGRYTRLLRDFRVVTADDDVAVDGVWLTNRDTEASIEL